MPGARNWVQVGALGVAIAVLLLSPSALAVGPALGGSGPTTSAGSTPAALAAGAPAWTLLHPSAVPQAFGASNLVYDAQAQAIIEFGGNASNGDPGNSTWAFAHGSWTNITPVRSPPPREFATLAYDARDGVVVLFGGEVIEYNSTRSNETYRSLGDTWTFANGTWTNVTSAAAPTPRQGAAFAYDPRAGGEILYGGETTDYTYNTRCACDMGPYTDALDDQTWKLVGRTWTNLTATADRSGMPVPVGSTTAYDARDQYLLLYGPRNTTGIGSKWTEETWEFSSGRWSPLRPSVVPTAWADPQLAFDPALHTTILYAGSSNQPNRCYGCSQTWGFSGGTWTRLVNLTGGVKIPFIVPWGRTSHAMAFDGRSGRLVMLTGATQGVGPGCGPSCWPASFETWTFP